MAMPRLFSSPTFRFSIRQLLVGTALVAVACVALRGASSTWVAALLGLVLLMLTAAVPLVIFRQGTVRAWWFGFALFGWLYLLLLAFSWSLDPNTSQSNPLRPYSLVTAQLSSSGYNRIYTNSSSNSANFIAPLVGPVSFSYPVTNVNGTITNATLVPANSVGSTVTANTGNGSSGNFTFYFGSTVASTFTGPSHDDFVNVAHAFWTVLIAVCGGWFTCWVYSTRPRDDTPQEKTQPGIPTTTS